MSSDDRAERTGALTITVRLEPGRDELWARLTGRRDVLGRDTSTVQAAGVEDVLVVVRDWLEEFERG